MNLYAWLVLFYRIKNHSKYQLNYTL
uniref:Uncharacterized protein n=1 Tax=Arundo donax TaxID=35708 RepID=A0A0A9BSM3_ARUDO